jgi:hypothetical protein
MTREGDLATPSHGVAYGLTRGYRMIRSLKRVVVTMGLVLLIVAATATAVAAVR